MERVLGKKNYAGYALGDLANGLSFGMSSTFLLLFYTDVLGIAAAAAGTLFFIARMIDAFTDPLIGAMTDKLFQYRISQAAGRRIQKFKPFILYGSGPVVLVSVALFIVPENLSTDQKLVWAYATYITWGMAYTLINIPYGSLAAVMTQHPVERVSLSAARSLGGALGAVIDRIAVPVILTAYVDDQGQGFLVAMSLLGALAFVSYLICYFTVEENIQTAWESPAQASFSQPFFALWRHRPFLAVSIASLAILGGFGTSGAMTVYFFQENLGALDLMSWTGLTVIGPILLCAPLIPKLVRRFGLRTTVSYSSLLGAAAFTVLFLLPTDPVIFLVGTFFCTIFLIIPMMSLWGMVSDSIDYNQYLSGVRQEGVIYGSYSFVRKTAQALAGVIAGWGLAFAGYVAGLDQQSDTTLMGIKFLTLGAPAISLLIAAFSFLWIWDLTPEKQAKINEAITKSD